MKRLTTRSIRTAEAIRDREEFNTSGSMMARSLTSGSSPWGAGRLAGADLDAYRRDMGSMSYIVWSYSTPIAWYVAKDKRWHIVAQKFSPTTTKHQGNLYLAAQSRVSA